MIIVAKIERQRNIPLRFLDPKQIASAAFALPLVWKFAVIGECPNNLGAALAAFRLEDPVEITHGVVPSALSPQKLMFQMPVPLA